MSARFTNLHCKEVVCLCDGRRLGFISDAVVDLCTGCLQSIIVPGKCRHFGLFHPRDEYVIPWQCIKRIGPDIVLVDIKPEEFRVPRGKPLLPF